MDFEGFWKILDLSIFFFGLREIKIWSLFIIDVSFCVWISRIFYFSVVCFRWLSRDFFFAVDSG